MPKGNNVVFNMFSIFLVLIRLLKWPLWVSRLGALRVLFDKKRFLPSRKQSKCWDLIEFCVQGIDMQTILPHILQMLPRKPMQSSKHGDFGQKWSRSGCFKPNRLHVEHLLDILYQPRVYCIDSLLRESFCSWPYWEFLYYTKYDIYCYLLLEITTTLWLFTVHLVSYRQKLSWLFGHYRTITSLLGKKWY